MWQGTRVLCAQPRHTYESSRPHREATWRFALVAFVGFLLTWGFMHAFINWLGAPYLAAQLVTTGIVMLWSLRRTEPGRLHSVGL